MRFFKPQKPRRNNHGRGRSDQAAESARRQVVEDAQHANVPTLEKRGTPPASKKAISDLIHLRLRASPPEEREASMECVVCAGDCQDGEIVTTLPCGHMFHSACVMKWLYRNCTCPTCRFELPTDDLEYEEERKPRMKKRLPAQEGGASTMILPDTIECIPDDLEYEEERKPRIKEQPRRRLYGSLSTFLNTSSKYSELDELHAQH
jgi:hypothetical protein